MRLNLKYSLLIDILTLDEFSALDVVCHFPTNMLIKNKDLLYNRISKRPVLAIEADGYDHHKEGATQ